MICINDDDDNDGDDHDNDDKFGRSFINDKCIA
jgi:hypothetical protein